ncbi:MAG: hypothetical protein FJX80_03435, partial [Bacteroidetes bacterium]|nr:hypothetical protein [Bacteroidota bacterium]
MAKRIIFYTILIFSFSVQSQTFTIGTGSFGTGTIPISTGYPYSYSQSIYPSNLLTSQGMSPGMAITSLAWYVNAPDPSSSNASWTIYLANSSQSSFSSTTSWIPDNLFTQVFSGTVIPSPAGWKIVNLVTPFVWDGSNLVIAVDENSPGNSPSPNLFLRTYFDYNTNISIYKGNSTNVITSSPGVATGLLLDYPNIRIGIGCWGSPNNASISLNPSIGCAGSPINITSTGASTGTGISYQWQSSPDAINWTNVGTNASSYSALPTSSLYYQMITTCS